MPQLGETVVEGTIDRWLKQEGDTVAKYEPIVEVITDKVNAEIPSPASGRLIKLVAVNGQTVACGAELGQIESDVAATDVSPLAATDTTDQAFGRDPQENDDLSGLSAEEALRRRSTPLVRRLAEHYGIDLAQVTGTGFGGRVRKEDLMSFVEARAQPSSPQTQIPKEPLDAPSHPEVQPDAVRTPADHFDVIALSAARRRIAEHMVASLRIAPQVTTAFEIDMTAVVRLRARHHDAFRARHGHALSYLGFFLKAVAGTLEAHPLLNAVWTDAGIKILHNINIGVAVAVPSKDGRLGGENLVVPVIRNADRLSLAEITAAADAIIRRARASNLAPDDVQGGSFTVNNTGPLGSIISTPILNQPQSANVSLEEIVKRPVVITNPDGSDVIAIRHMAFSCLTFDHRVLDGFAATNFMRALKIALENADEHWLD
jgi:pyruvate/2-oxoglutarate dehydrogenase complex dihydrolipoamide acyltransferase (E2) component